MLLNRPGVFRRISPNSLFADRVNDGTNVPSCLINCHNPKRMRLYLQVKCSKADVKYRCPQCNVVQNPRSIYHHIANCVRYVRELADTIFPPPSAKRPRKRKNKLPKLLIRVRSYRACRKCKRIGFQFLSPLSIPPFSRATKIFMLKLISYVVI